MSSEEELTRNEISNAEARKFRTIICYKRFNYNGDAVYLMDMRENIE